MGRQEQVRRQLEEGLQALPQTRRRIALREPRLGLQPEPALAAEEGIADHERRVSADPEGALVRVRAGVRLHVAREVVRDRVRLGGEPELAEVRGRRVHPRVEGLHELGGAAAVPEAGQDDDDRPPLGERLDVRDLGLRVEEDEGVARVEGVRADVLLPSVRPSLLWCPRRVRRGPCPQPGAELLHHGAWWQTASMLLPSGSRTYAA
jgi:hypothetical protein